MNRLCVTSGCLQDEESGEAEGTDTGPFHTWHVAKNTNKMLFRNFSFVDFA